MSFYIKEVSDERAEETNMVTIPLETYTWLIERSSRLEVAEELVPKGMSLAEVLVRSCTKEETQKVAPKKEEILPETPAESENDDPAQEPAKDKERCPDVPKLKALLAAGRDVHFIAVEWGVSEEIAEKWIAQAQPRRGGRPRKKEA